MKRQPYGRNSSGTWRVEVNRADTHTQADSRKEHVEFHEVERTASFPISQVRAG